MASTQQDVANLVVTLQADVRRFHASMQQATKDVDKTVRDIGARIDRMSRDQERAWERMGRRSGEAYRSGLRRGGLGGFGIGTVIGTTLGSLFDPMQWIRQAARAGDASAQAFLDAWKDVGDDIAISLSNKIIAGLKAAFPEAMKNLPGANETIIRRTPYTGPPPEVSGTGAQRGRQIAQALLNRGYHPEVVRGILASLRGEQSEFDPTAVNPTSGAIGFAQWLTPSRVRLLESISAATGSPKTGMYAQIGTLNRELDTTYAHVDKMLRGAKDANQAMEIFTRYYEVPAKNERDMQARLAERRRYLGTQIPYGTEEELRRRLIEEAKKPQAPAAAAKEGERLAVPVMGTEQLDAQVKAYEERNRALDEYLKRQDLANQLTKAEAEASREKIIQLRAEQEARQLNVDLGTKEFDQIKQRVAMTYDLEQAQTKQAEAQKNQAAAMESMQQVGDAVAGAVNTFVQGLINGQDAAEALSNALKQLASQLLSMAINQLFSGLFGGGGGLFGGILGGGGAGGPLGMATSRVSAGAPLGKGGMGTTNSIGGTTINVAGNADAVTVQRMAKMIEVNNQRQSAKLNREWGARAARYSSLRGP